MLKVKMLTRFTGFAGKMEPGHEYLLPAAYARKLVEHGLAVWVLPPAASMPVNVTLKPTRTQTMDRALREMRAKNQATMDKGKKRK